MNNKVRFLCCELTLHLIAFIIQEQGILNPPVLQGWWLHFDKQGTLLALKKC
jgi:hypothetical protein